MPRNMRKHRKSHDVHAVLPRETTDTISGKAPRVQLKGPMFTWGVGLFYGSSWQ